MKEKRKPISLVTVSVVTATNRMCGFVRLARTRRQCTPLASQPSNGRRLSFHIADQVASQKSYHIHWKRPTAGETSISMRAARAIAIYERPLAIYVGLSNTNTAPRIRTDRALFFGERALARCLTTEQNYSSSLGVFVSGTTSQ